MLDSELRSTLLAFLCQEGSHARVMAASSGFGITSPLMAHALELAHTFSWQSVLLTGQRNAGFMVRQDEDVEGGTTALNSFREHRHGNRLAL